MTQEAGSFSLKQYDDDNHTFVIWKTNNMHWISGESDDINSYTEMPKGVEAMLANFSNVIGGSPRSFVPSVLEYELFDVVSTGRRLRCVKLLWQFLGAVIVRLGRPCYESDKLQRGMPAEFTMHGLFVLLNPASTHKSVPIRAGFEILIPATWRSMLWEAMISMCTLLLLT
ncbi:hypothetical protein Acr_06g0002870 [Actinidia rufa]|uniref:Uncharacterized protein n=1 Tax=Actinidia rufa TaxID=165716 RepID=A0A7J0ES14_9ERIC|nr:hypothetical protein Acr_06g0002870 [Actinidia rufa]